MISRLVCAALVMVFSSTVDAGPSDFAMGRVLVPVRDAPVQHVLLPEDVYRWTTRDDLGDLRVFGGGNEEIAYALMRPARSQEHTDWQALPMFRLPTPDTPDGEGAAVNIELADGGAVVAVRGGRVEAAAAQSYLLDASAYDQPIVELRFHWVATDDVVTQVRVEGADDLDVWRELVASSSLATLTAGAEQVQLDRIVLPTPTRTRYLRVTRLGGGELDIQTIEVRSRESRAPERQWADLQGEAVDGGLEFDTGGRFPVDRVSVELDRPSYLVEVALYSRADPSHPWRDRGHRTFYRVAVDGAEASSDALKFASPYHRHWRIEVLGATPEIEPQLRAGWAPDRLVFANQGQAPYTLAYGSGDFSGRQWPMRDLLRRLDPEQLLSEVPMATLGHPETMGGPARLEPAPEPVDWETVVLWAVLVLGVLVIGTLAVRLLRS